MFALHETTRKWICRTAFFALCVAPALGTAAWILARHRPGRVAALAGELGAHLHAAATASDWREPRPGMTRIAELSLAPPGSKKELTRVEGLQWRRSGGRMLISAECATIEGGSAAEFAAMIGGWLGDLQPNHCDLQLARTRFVPTLPAEATAAFELHSVRGRVERKPTGDVVVQLAGRTGDKSGPILRLSVEKVVSPHGEMFHVKLDAAEADVPAWIIGLTTPGFSSFGRAAWFRGVMEMDADGSRLSGSLVGSASDVDVAAAWPKESSHVVRGTARLEIAEMRWRQGRLEALSGTAALKNGQASRSTIAAAATHLLCVPLSDGSVAAAADGGAIPIAPSDPSQLLIAIDQLACRFLLNEKGLTLTGDFPIDSGLPEGCLAVSGGSPLLKHPPCVELPAGAWVQFVMGPSASWLPATRGAVDVAERLPLPGGNTTQLR